MTKRIPQPRWELSPSVREHEAKLLAVMLRTSRLTVVFGEPGTDTGALLKSGVMPLLQRRRDDRAAAAAGTASPFAGQERRRPRPGRRAEVAVHFEDWEQDPLSALRRRIIESAHADAAEVGDVSLAGALQQLHRRSGLHFVLLLDRFERYLARAHDEREVGRFTDELTEAILWQKLPASFLIAMDESARSRLEHLRARLPGFDDNVLRLSPVSAARQPTPESSPVAAENAADARQPRRPPPRVPIRVEDVYALIESKLTRSRASKRPDK